MSSAKLEAKLFRVSGSISTDFKDLYHAIEHLQMKDTQDKLFFRATLPCCPSVLLISEHHQQNSKTNSKVLVCTTLLLLSRAEI